MCALCAALGVTLVASSVAPPPAEAAFPGRNVVSDRDGTFRLYTMRSNGARVARLVDIEIMGDAEPDWGPRP